MNSKRRRTENFGIYCTMNYLLPFPVEFDDIVRNCRDLAADLGLCERSVLQRLKYNMLKNVAPMILRVQSRILSLELSSSQL